MRYQSEAETVDISYREDITAVDLPNAKTVDARGCTALTALPDLPNAEYVEEVLATDCWDCHSWSNCPMHAAFGANDIAEAPKEWQSRAALFVNMFDAGMLEKPQIA